MSILTEEGNSITVILEESGVSEEICLSDESINQDITLELTGEKGPIGPQGEPGPIGPQGPQGEQGIGIPTGGSAGQILGKISETDYDVNWVDDAGFDPNSNQSITGNWSFVESVKIGTQNSPSKLSVYSEDNLADTPIADFGRLDGKRTLAIRNFVQNNTSFEFNPDKTLLQGNQVRFNLYQDATVNFAQSHTGSTLKSPNMFLTGNFFDGTNNFSVNSGFVFTPTYSGGGFLSYSVQNAEGLKIWRHENRTPIVNVGNNLLTNGVLNVTPNWTGKVGVFIKGLPSQTANLLEIQNSDSTKLMTFDPLGKLGVGISSPTSKMHIVNNTAGQSALKIDGGNLTNTYGIDIINSGPGTTGIRISRGASTVALAVSLDGRSASRYINSGGHTFNSAGTIGLLSTEGAFKFTQDVNSKNSSYSLFQLDNNLGENSKIMHVTDSTNAEIFNIVDSGNIGLGVITPTEKIHVSGNIYIQNGKLIMDSPTKTWEITIDDNGVLTTTEVV